MDLSQFVTQDKANEGEWFPVSLYGKPADFDLLILGDDSDAVQKHNRQAMKKLKGVMAKSAKSGEVDFDDDAVDEIAASNDDAVIARVAGIRGWKTERKGLKVTGREPEPVTLNGEEIKNDPASYRLLIRKIPALKEFVLNTARDRANFLSKPSGN